APSRSLSASPPRGRAPRAAPHAVGGAEPPRHRSTGVLAYRYAGRPVREDSGGAMWPLDLPPYDHRDWWARKAAAWVSRLLPPEAGQAVPELHVRPRAAGRVAWRWMHASLNARGRDLGTLSMSAVISR